MGSEKPVLNPAVTFFERAQRLTRLQALVLAAVESQLEADLTGYEALRLSDALGREGKDDQAFSESVEMLTDFRLLLHIFFCRHVDNFQIFLEDISRAILTARPDLLGLSAGASQELIEDRATEIGFRRLRDQAKVVQRDFGFEYFPNPTVLTSVDRFFELRNIVTHQYGIVTKRFLARYPSPGLTLGMPYPFTVAEILKDWMYLVEVSFGIMHRAGRQFGIPFPDAEPVEPPSSPPPRPPEAAK